MLIMYLSVDLLNLWLAILGVKRFHLSHCIKDEMALQYRKTLSD